MQYMSIPEKRDWEGDLYEESWTNRSKERGVSEITHEAGYTASVDIRHMGEN